jgi:hypothetical protein
VEASPSSQNNYSTAFSMPPAKTQREIELDQREMELKLREERVHFFVSQTRFLGGLYGAIYA